jgi:hypothetical protein
MLHMKNLLCQLQEYYSSGLIKVKQVQRKDCLKRYNVYGSDIERTIEENEQVAEHL